MVEAEQGHGAMMVVHRSPKSAAVLVTKRLILPGSRDNLRGYEVRDEAMPMKKLGHKSTGCPKPRSRQ